MRRIIFSALLFFIFPHLALAQQAIQKSTCGPSSTTPQMLPPSVIAPDGLVSGVGSCSFALPVTAGSTLVAIVTYSCDPAGNCNNLVDNKGQIWKLALEVRFSYNTNLYYFTNSGAGNISLSFLPRTALSVVLLEYPPVVGVDATSSGFYDDISGGFDDANEFGWVKPFETSGYGELIIGYVTTSIYIGCSFNSGPDFSAEAIAGNLQVEDMISTRPNIYSPTIYWPNCGGVHWTMGAVAFKMK
jgi:hypothetical protein